ncbi:MAG TPA: hypothetical protein VK668_22000 [Mucilaginibacter sp.]|nr:hypothetical protein [Mucilaginibacter sp.]
MLQNKIIRPLNCRGGLVTFVATKVTKKAFSRKASLPHLPLPGKSGKTGAANYCPKATHSQCCGKICYALPAHRPALFCLISSEAVLLTGEEKLSAQTANNL